MMDSQEKNLEQGAQEEVTRVEENARAAEAPVTNSEAAADDNAQTQQAVDSNAEETKTRKVYTSKKEILERAKEIAHSEEAPDKAEIDNLKTAFYKLHNNEREEKLKKYIEEGGEPDSYQFTPDEDEEAFKAEMGLIREKRARIFKEQEEEKERNLQKKLDIIEKIKAMATTPEEANNSYKEFKALQQEWKEIKNIPAAKANEVWRNYQLYVEQYYDLLKLNSEAREYDFKKNLEKKTHLCEAAEKLAEEPDVISAFHQLQKLHEEYRETGPVAKELRESIWARFKAASTVVNKRHQQHFDEVKAKEEDNLARKTAICEKLEALLQEENKGSADWEKHTKAVIGMQAEWKTIGFAPQKMNVKIFERFRKACDEFFEKKGEYYKKLKETFKVNAEKKRQLIAKVNELKDSTEWRSTSDKIRQLQKEWKTIGTTPKKIGDQLWEEFIGACNHFFDARNAATAGTRNEERANLTKKRDVIERLKAFDADAEENAQEAVKKLIDEFNGIGHVPFSEKDKLYDEFHSLVDGIYKKMNKNVASRRLNNFKNRLKSAAASGESNINSERARLMRQFEAIKNEVQTYENNIGFLNVSSKKGNSLIEEMKRKVQKLKDDMQLVKDKIKAIDQQDKDNQ